MFKLSYHAQQRLEERFPNANLQEELKDLIELGGQHGPTKKAYLTKSDIVILVSDGVITTVMPKHIYFGNVADVAGDKFDHKALLPKRSRAKKSKQNKKGR